MGTNLECDFNSQTINEFHLIVISSKFIAFIENIHKLKEKPMTTKRDIFCSKLQLFRIPKLKENYLVYVLFKCNYNYLTTHNYGTKNHKLKQKIKLQKAYIVQVEYFMQGSFANNKLQLKHDNQSHCIKYKIKLLQTHSQL
jgi:hypothetical protein